MKKIISLIIMFLITFCLFGNVDAKVLTIEEVKAEYDEIFIKTMNESVVEESGKLSSVIDTDNKTFNLFSGENKISTLTYTDSYIEFNQRDIPITEEAVEYDFWHMLSIGYLMQSIVNLSGYEDKSLGGDEDTFKNSFDTYGLQMETEPYEIEGEFGTSSGDFIRYFKISLDTSKIDKLMEDYGINPEDSDPIKYLLENATPKITTGDVKEKEVTITPSVPGLIVEDDYEIPYTIYRSTSEDGEYKEVFKGKLSKNNSFVDKELTPGTTYYYKVVITGYEKYSEVVEITTASVTPPKEEKKNPETGAVTTLRTIVILMTLATIGLGYSVKNKVFR